MNFKKLAHLIYPFLVALILAVSLVLAMRTEPSAEAGMIRTVEISPEHPLVVRLAQGHTTAISFAVRPEKVVPGNPQALEINFLSKDLTLRPLAPHPGNLIIYTKSNRYVILLQIGSENNYDDVVSVRAYGALRHSLRLTDDTFHVDTFSLSSGQLKREIVGDVSGTGNHVTFDTLPLKIKCKGCIVKTVNALTEIACKDEIKKLSCKSGADLVQIVRIQS